jgi:glycosyltransferase involved in cell wall biosynthesis
MFRLATKGPVVLLCTGLCRAARDGAREMRNVLIVCMNSTEGRDGGSNVALQNSLCFYEAFRNDRIHYFGLASAYWKTRAHHYREVPRRRSDDVLARLRLRTNFLCLHIDAFLREREVAADFDCVLLSNSRLGYVAQAVRPRTRVLMTFFANIEVDYIQNKYRTPWVSRVDHLIFRMRERQCAKLSDFSLFVTARDVARHDELYGRARYAMLPVASPERNVVKKQASEVRLAFVGSLSYAPNVEAVQYIVAELLPRIESKLLLAGSNPTAEITSLVDAHKQRIEFHPNYATLDGVLSDRDIFVSPLARGAGMKVKVAECLAMGVPILGSEETFIGYEAVPEVAYLTCHTAQDYLTKLRELADPERYASICRGLHAAWKEHYSLESSLAAFASACASLQLLDGPADC